jgi:Holliday junction DNA helicase RuvA
MTPHNTNKDEALSALEVLGFNKKMAEKVIDQIIVQFPDETVENLIKQALKKL